MRLQGKRGKVLAGLLAGGLVLGSAALLYAAGEHEGGKSAFEASLTPERLKDLGWRFMNFIALVIILVKFLKKPLADGLAARQKTITDEITALQDRKVEVEKNYRECEAKLAGIDEQVEAILANAKSQGEALKTRLIEDGARAAEDMKRKAEMAIQYELSEARSRLQEEIVDQATLMAEELIKSNLQESDQNAIVEGYLEKVGAIQ